MERPIARSLVVRVEGTQPGEPRDDLLAVEEPLEIQLGYERRGWRVHKSVSVTMRTPGADDELAAGFLFTEAIIGDAAHIEAIRTEAPNVIRVELRAGITVDLRRLERHFYTTSSCGVCGKASIAALNLPNIRRPAADRPVFDAATVHGLPATLRGTQAVFDQTGGLHAAALFEPGGRLVAVREDVGRHNAVDKLIGSQLLAGRSAPLDGNLLFVSGRASFELVQKALAAGLPMLAAVGAPSSLAVGLAQAHGMTLLGFVRGGRFNIYAGERRIRETSRGDFAGEVLRPTPPRVRCPPRFARSSPSRLFMAPHPTHAPDPARMADPAHEPQRDIILQKAPRIGSDAPTSLLAENPPRQRSRENPTHDPAALTARLSPRS